MNQYYKKTALEKLSGNWGTAILVTFVATLILNGASSLISIALSISGVTQTVVNKYIILNIIPSSFEIYESLWDEAVNLFKVLILEPAFIVFLGFAIIILIALSFISSCINVGLKSFYLNLVTQKEKAEISNLFSYFSCFWKPWVLMFLTYFFIALWSLLFIIPGIIAAYSYSMAPFIYAENPELSPLEAIRRSKQMMQGHRLDLFLLNLSFFGWILLAAFCSCGLGEYVLIPYMTTAEAAFYLDISGHDAIGGEYEENYSNYNTQY